MSAGLFFGVGTSVVITLILLRLDGLGGLVPAAFFGGIAIVAISLGSAILALFTGVISHFVRRNETAPARVAPMSLNVGAVPDRIR